MTQLTDRAVHATSRPAKRTELVTVVWPTEAEPVAPGCEWDGARLEVMRPDGRRDVVTFQLRREGVKLVGVEQGNGVRVLDSSTRNASRRGRFNTTRVSHLRMRGQPSPPFVTGGGRSSVGGRFGTATGGIEHGAGRFVASAAFD